jgi:hypothetical protein
MLRVIIVVYLIFLRENERKLLSIESERERERERKSSKFKLLRCNCFPLDDVYSSHANFSFCIKNAN